MKDNFCKALLFDLPVKYDSITLRVIIPSIIYKKISILILNIIGKDMTIMLITIKANNINIIFVSFLIFIIIDYNYISNTSVKLVCRPLSHNFL